MDSARYELPWRCGQNYGLFRTRAFEASGCAPDRRSAAEGDAKLKLDFVRDVVVDLTWDPAWTPARLTDAGRRALGLDGP
jgi:hypothetical protein